MVALRWVTALPASLVAGWVAWFPVFHLTRLVMRRNDINPEGWLALGFAEFVSHFAFSFAFVLAGALVVPRHGKKVGYLLAGIQLILAGFFLCFALFTRDHSLIWGLAGGVIGAGHIAYKISVDDIQVEEPEGNEYSPLRAELEQLIQESKVLKDSKATTPMNNGE